MPEPPKKEEAAPSDQSKENEADAGDPPPPKTSQERSERDKAKAAKRFNDLLEENKRLKAEVESRTPKAEPPAKEQPAKPQTYQEWRKEFKPAEWIEKYAKDNPSDSYEDATAAMSDYLDERREEFRSAERNREAQARDFKDKIAKAESRYENFNEIADPFAGEILADTAISPVVKQMFRDSEIMPDLLFTIGSSEKDRAEFLKMAKENPGKAIRYIALTESLIADELEGKVSNEPKPDPPVKPQTAAPKPPTEIGGRAATPGDELANAAKANDFRAFKAEATRRQLAKLKG